METYNKDKNRADLFHAPCTGGPDRADELNLPDGSGLPIGYVTDGFFIKHGDMLVKVSYRDIVWVEAGGNYSHIHFKSNPHITVVHHLGRLEEMLPKKYFTRINKSEIVNLYLVDRFCGNMLYINKRSYTIAPAYREYVFSCFNILTRKR